MATSNRDRVGRGFEILAAGLEPFIAERMAAALPKGADWAKILDEQERKKGGSRTYSRHDPHAQLKLMTEEWRPFRDYLSRTEQNMIGELREIRNKWAHNERFTSEQTYRALDTMVFVLVAVGAMEQADEVRQIRDDHQRAVYEAELRKAAKAAAATPMIEGNGLKPWREVLRPHDDVASGNFNASEFAADLHMVTRGQASPEYLDPVEFFRRTYLTEGLRDLLGRAVRRVGGDANATPVINLQTNFGGGKTHSMLALYHLFSGHPTKAYPPELQELVAGRDLTKLGKVVHRATLVGNHIAPGKSNEKDDGTKVRTLWGELAWQLGGREAYDLVAEADATSTNPGEGLRHLISRYAPCVILIDEWVSYARQLWDRDDLPAGTFDTQFTFAQTLTETVKSVPGALLVISIPASHESDKQNGQPDAGSDVEVGGRNGREALKRLQNVVRRVADQWRPATAQESFEIVRRRLFEEPDGQALAYISLIARKFVSFYREHRGEFPSECGELPYEDRIKAAYPIHPELFDRLYEDWSTLERFQRTRGVLRLMSSVVHVLWKANDAAPMIMPGSIPFDASIVLDEFAQYLEDAWKPIVDTDIDGENSTPVRIDQQRKAFGQRALTRRLARTIFVGSAATLRSAHKGIEQQRIYLGVAMPGDTVGNFGSALHLLSDRATYLYVDGARYWYDTQASVSRTAKDYAERLHDEDVWAEISTRLGREQRARGDFARVHPAIEDSGNIPDTDEARLVILHPRYTHLRGQDDSSPALRFAWGALETRGSAQRSNRNMLVFLAADAKRFTELDEAVREYLAWKSITERIKELNLSHQQATQASSRLANADRAVTLRIASTYHWALVPVQPNADRPVEWEVVKAEGSKERLAERTSDKLGHSDLLRAVQGARVIRQDLDRWLHPVWDRGHITVGELWSYYCRYPYLPRLRDRSVLETGIRAVLDEITWEHEGFALARGYDERTGDYEGLAIPHEDTFGQITDSTLLVHPRRAAQQRVREKVALAVTQGAAAGVQVQPTEHPGVYRPVPAGEPEPAPPTPQHVRFFGVSTLNPERYARDFARIAQEILPHLTGEGIELTITVEISARHPDGFPEEKVRTVTENAHTLKFDQVGFEQS